MTTSVKEEQFKIFDNVAKAYVDKVFSSLVEAEAHKEQLLDNGEYPDRPHTVFEIHPVVSVKEEVKHTALPWEAIADYDDSNIRIALTKDNEIYTDVARIEIVDEEYREEEEANAQFIVKACNSHYELLEASKRVLKALADTGILLDERLALFEAIKKAEQ